MLSATVIRELEDYTNATRISILEAENADLRAKLAVKDKAIKFLAAQCSNKNGQNTFSDYSLLERAAVAEHRVVALEATNQNLVRDALSSEATATVAKQQFTYAINLCRGALAYIFDPSQLRRPATTRSELSRHWARFELVRHSIEGVPRYDDAHLMSAPQDDFV